MKFQRNTVILVSVAAVLSVVVLISEAQRSRTGGLNETGEVANRDRLFSFEESDVTQLTVEQGGQTLVFERDDNDTWQMLEPEAVLAEQAAIAFLLNLVTTSGPSRVFTIEPAEQDNFGLDAPTATITLTLASGDTHMLLLGAADFSGGSVYAVADTDLAAKAAAEEDIEVEVIPVDFVNAVTRELSEWQATVDEPDAEEPPADSPSEDDADTNGAEPTPSAPDADSTPEEPEASSEAEPSEENAAPEATNEPDLAEPSSPESEEENADEEN